MAIAAPTAATTNPMGPVITVKAVPNAGAMAIIELIPLAKLPSTRSNGPIAAASPAIITIVFLCLR